MTKKKTRTSFLPAPFEFSDFLPLSADNTKGQVNKEPRDFFKFNETEEKLRDILDESVKKWISFLTISDCDQEKNQDWFPTCPFEFSDFPPLSADNTKGQINKEPRDFLDFMVFTVKTAIYFEGTNKN